ncbi:MAG TPA: hypothetical protein VHA73_14035 [Acidimicrobiales bacterium]|nr:hypothetical protein [Acidimicrobiales bacterium]
MTDERSRHQLYVTLEEHLGAHEADTLMELLPPVGWADVATKHDLHALEQRIDLRFDAMEATFATKEDLAALQRSMVTTMITTMVALLGTFSAVILTAIALIR